MTTSVTSKGQVTIPVAVRRLLRIRPHDKVTFRVQDGRVEIMRGRSFTDLTAGMFRSNLPPLTPREENDIFEQPMAEEAEPTD